MLTEQSAYSNRWRKVSPIAKGIFTFCGILAAFSAGSPVAALAVAIFISCAAIVGAAVPFFIYLRVAAPPLLFLAASTLSLSFSLDLNAPAIHFAESELPNILHICSRSFACLTSLLFLTLTTPLPDIISLLRRCKTPETLLDLMILCYRTLFVLSESVNNTITAQSARLGYATPGHSIRSLGRLSANLTMQVWQRSTSLQLAVEARCNDGAFRFLEADYPNSRRNILISATSGISMILCELAFS
ncbi:MAG: cobalt ECF transporter T component CbiQ [Desulfuromonadaceae bacterium]|nr:cobalt ECF transporter T component CbiQ [Desulfuromonadaceae bacterium]MDD2854778.1 cobalt ECF transporter T component CbiQ [Desulfuromonadaceae bacterium]